MSTPASGPVLRHRDRVAGPWANGGGITYEVLRSPQAGADFDWRVSIAEIANDGPFSPYPGVDRVLVLLRGAMHLVIDGVSHEAPLFSPLEFAGESHVEARLSQGPTMDLNVMTRRDLVEAQVDVLTGPAVRLGRAHAAARAVIVLDGTWTAVGVGPSLETWDCLVTPQATELRGDGTLACVTLRTRGHEPQD